MLDQVREGVSKEINRLLNKHKKSYDIADTPRKQMERLLALFTAIKIAISMKEVKEKEMKIDKLNKQIEELKELLKRKDEELEKMKLTQEGRMEEIRKAWDAREKEQAEFARKAKLKLEMVYKSAQENIDELLEENKRCNEDICRLVGLTKVNTETGEGSSSNIRP